MSRTGASMQMSEDNPPRKLKTPPPAIDRSKWTGRVPLAKPIDPKDVVEAARAIKADADLWSIFENLRRDDWISEENSGRLARFYRAYFESQGRPDVTLRGQEMMVLRALVEGGLASLDDEEAVVCFIKNKRPSGI